MKNVCAIINNGLLDLKFKTYGTRDIYVHEECDKKQMWNPLNTSKNDFSVTS